MGTVFSVPVTGGSATTLASCYITNGGYYPHGGVIVDGNTLYGTTESGGINGIGTVYSVPITGGSLTTLVSFGRSSVGYEPAGNLVLSGDTLYGTSTYSGNLNQGNVFSVPITGGMSTALTTFTGANGSDPQAGLIISADGSTLYGTTTSGGAYGHGTIFSLPVTGGSPTTLVSFNGADGESPNCDLALVGGILYGTTVSGVNNYGTVFSVPVTGGSPTTLVTFTGANGANPYAGLTLVGNILYGTTYTGGANNDGTVFAVTIPEPPAICMLVYVSTLCLRRLNRKAE